MSVFVNRSVWQGRSNLPPIWRRAVAIIAVVCLVSLQGCASATFVTASPAKTLAEQVDIGDRVRVTTAGGEKIEFVVTKVDKDGLYDQEKYYRFDEMTEVRIQQMMSGTSASTIMMVAIIAGAVIVVALIKGVRDTTEDVLGTN